jgi:hypothetical protein
MMNRRQVLQNLTFGVGGLLALPAWANAWKPDLLIQATTLSLTEENFLAEIVATIIPKTDTLGAKEIGVQKFVQRMLNDCFAPNEQENFRIGLQKTEELAVMKFKKSFMDFSSAEKLALLKEIQNSEDKTLKSYFTLLKRLTIQGYMNSEYVMTNLTKFEFAPARFHGCVKIIP